MATTPSELTEGTVAISENEVDGKYLLIKVPDFAKDPSGDPEGKVAPARYNEGMTSFLRLGAASTVPEPGDDLVQHAYEGGAGPVGFTGELELADGSTVKTAYIDDERNRGAGDVEPLEAQGHGMTRDERYNWHTKHLETKGGWRDHSDGNRISTTYGDKLEVIRGNYKLIVMGRQDDPSNAQGHEWSGNHVQDWGQGTMPGASVTLEWIQNGYDPGTPLSYTPPSSADDPTPEVETFEGGAWLLINSTERVYQYSRNAGNFCTQQWGDKLEAYVGSEDPERIGTTPGVGYRGQPTEAEIKAFHKVADTFADDDDRSLVRKLRPSSFGLPRGNPEIIEKTWAKSMSSSTGSAAWKIPQINEDTWAVSMTDHTDAQTITSTTKVETKKETTTAGSIVSTTYAGAIVDTTIAGMIVSTTIAPLIDTYIGIRLAFDLSGAIEVSTALKAEFVLGEKTKFSVTEEQITTMKNSITLLNTNVATTATELTNIKNTVATTSTELTATKNELATVSTALAAKQNKISGIFSILTGAAFIG